MINVTELRRGNIIMGADSDSIIYVEWKTIKLLELYPAVGSPMLLTMAWLMRSGHVGTIVSKHKEREQQITSWVLQDKWCIYQHGHSVPKFKIILGGLTISIEFVHRLQNLYFELYNEELSFSKFDTDAYDKWLNFLTSPNR